MAPRKPGPRKRYPVEVTVFIDQATRDELDDAAEAAATTVSGYVRRAIRRALNDDRRRRDREADR